MERKIWMGFHVLGQPGPCLKPFEIRFWQDEDFKKNPPEKPLRFFSDALVGLSAIHLNPHLKNPFTSPKMNFSFCHEAWLTLEPHHELMQKSQPRIKSLQSHLKEIPNSITQHFEKSISEILDQGITAHGIKLTELTNLIETIDFMESEIERPLLYNFSLKLSKPLHEKLSFLHSLLFNLRALIAMDYNSFVHDPTFEAIKMDSISDYLPKAEYVTNDAILYFQTKKMKDQIPEKQFQMLQKNFWDYSHNGACLIENLPKSFLSSLKNSQLEETLYLIQMDWLLGTDAGLLFRIREELFALQEGYEKIFWTDLDGKSTPTPGQLSVSCELTESDIFPRNAVA
jgi:hypothetical protein